ncbi:MAG: outer membrane lipoprotein-sorting protein, partial [SAR324 cluster bacterium]|nr:outer membrane lipoprotein-sorting protein [SAR324 cluster bacterium]
DESGKDDDQWLYLPALRKTKRIASGDKSGSFMGSDLNYSDMSSPYLNLYNFTLMKETEVKGQKVWQIKSVPKTKVEAEKSGYSKSVFFIRQDNYVMIRGVRWVYKKNRNKYLDVRKLEKIDGIWVSTEMHVTTKSGRKTLHKTILKENNIKFNQSEVNKDLFTIRRLEKGL